ncbi:MAG: hypothetical protein OEX04_02235 [Acidimicrobiia bacterium]|nr:hypothetical protein [Acidimicrobiia bacterium]MDH4306274.1 hypothetical protein [Acidimicrobiia bacterium]MDH5292262.1 hypothetical protein [Acidimicrobiia bacterium]
MVEVEAVSIEIREQRKEDDNEGARSREELIKQLVERRIAEDPGGTVINIGAHHAQKSHLMGTEQQWLGDYLAHESPVVEGPIIVIGSTSARTELEALVHRRLVPEWLTRGSVSSSLSVLPDRPDHSPPKPISRTLDSARSGNLR